MKFIELYKTAGSLVRCWFVCTCISICMAGLGACDERCVNDLALNYTETLPCIFPSDVLSGTWSVTEYQDGDSTVFDATITPTDETHIQIVSALETPPVWHLEDIVMTLDWEEMVMYRPANAVSGTITDQNNFRLNYKFGTPDEVFNVSRRYSR